MRLLWASVLALAVSALAPAQEVDGFYGYGTSSVEAVAAYRQGWEEILLHGRWAEAERLYRSAVKEAPGFLIAKAVLARITADPRERQALREQVLEARSRVDRDGQLILATYLQTLELLIAREEGHVLAPGFREALAQRAIRDYGAFLERYPGEWPVLIEYVEWVHAARGPQAALDEVGRRRLSSANALEFSYFPAYFRAELGQIDTARILAQDFIGRLPDPLLPQAHYIQAYIEFRDGNLREATEAIERALEREPGHLLAQRLRRQIEDAVR